MDNRLMMAEQIDRAYLKISAGIEGKIDELNKCLEKYRKSVQTGKSILTCLTSSLEKLHLNILNEGSQASVLNIENSSVTRGALYLRLTPDKEFKFVKWRGYNSRGAARNEASANSKAAKITTSLLKAIPSEYGASIYVNPYSVSKDNKGVTGDVMVEIYYNI